MFTVEINQKIVDDRFELKMKFKVEFLHCQGVTDYTSETELYYFLGHPGTYCRITDEIGASVSSGKTVLHTNDNYDKNFGRKLSLARALKNGGFSTPERTLFWEAYFKARGKVN